MSVVKSVLRRFGAGLATAYILMYFSEYFFVNDGAVLPWTEHIQGGGAGILLVFQTLLGMVLFYFPPAFIFLLLVHGCRVRDLWGLFLAGAVFGWIVEGVIVPVVYESLPWTIVWPSLGWHAIVDVCFGWFVVRWILLKKDFRWTFALACGLGLFWGVWATWYWGGEETAPFAPGPFAVFAFITSCPMILALMVLDRITGYKFRESPRETIVESILVGGLMTLWFCVGIVPTQRSWWVLPVFMIIVLAALWRNKRTETRSNLLTLLDGKVPLAHYSVLLLVPVLAAPTYAGIHSLGVENTGIMGPVVFLLTGSSVVLFFLSLIVLFFFKRRTEHSGSAPEAPASE